MGCRVNEGPHAEVECGYGFGELDTMVGSLEVGAAHVNMCPAHRLGEK